MSSLASDRLTPEQWHRLVRLRWGVETTHQILVRAGSAPDLPLSILNQVARDHASVVLGNAARDPRFGNDPHVSRRRVGSLACLPMLRQGRLAGVL